MQPDGILTSILTASNSNLISQTYSKYKSKLHHLARSSSTSAKKVHRIKWSSKMEPPPSDLVLISGKQLELGDTVLSPVLWNRGLYLPNGCVMSVHDISSVKLLIGKIPTQTFSISYFSSVNSYEVRCHCTLRVTCVSMAWFYSGSVPLPSSRLNWILNL